MEVSDKPKTPRPRTRIQLVTLPQCPGLWVLQRVETVGVTDNIELAGNMLRALEQTEVNAADPAGGQ